MIRLALSTTLRFNSYGCRNEAGRKKLKMSGFASGKLATILPGRSCGECSLCCELLRIDSLAKPVGTWCPHCKPGKGGCVIYGEHPVECQRFICSQPPSSTKHGTRSFRKWWCTSKEKAIGLPSTLIQAFI